jgi:hypothetical protein
MEHSPDEDYACQCDPAQAKSRRPRPKKEVHKPDPSKVFDGFKQQKPPPKPAQKKSKARKPAQKKSKPRKKGSQSRA